MSQHIKDQIKRLADYAVSCDLVAETHLAQDLLLGFILSELVAAEDRGEAKALNTLRHVVAELKSIERTNMITAESLKASSDALTEAVTAAVALIQPGTPASTPDDVVKTFQTDVDAQTARLAAAEGATPPVPTPAP
jgi:hypothetical protein